MMKKRFCIDVFLRFGISLLTNSQCTEFPLAWPVFESSLDSLEQRLDSAKCLQICLSGEEKTAATLQFSPFRHASEYFIVASPQTNLSAFYLSCKCRALVYPLKYLSFSPQVESFSCRKHSYALRRELPPHAPYTKHRKCGAGQPGKVMYYSSPFLYYRV